MKINNENMILCVKKIIKVKPKPIRPEICKIIEKSN